MVWGRGREGKCRSVVDWAGWGERMILLSGPAGLGFLDLPLGHGACCAEGLKRERGWRVEVLTRRERRRGTGDYGSPESMLGKERGHGSQDAWHGPTFPSFFRGAQWRTCCAN